MGVQQMLGEEGEKHLLQLVYAKEDGQLQEIKKRCSEYIKYFFNIRRNITIAYDKSILYIIHKDSLKLIDIGKTYPITDLAYNYEKNMVAFLTAEGHLYAHFTASKTQVLIRKDLKKVFILDWVYSAQATFSFFLAEEGGVRLYRVEEEKKQVKEVKFLSGKHHCYLYEPFGEVLAAFPYGDCDFVNLFHFDSQRAKGWFKAGEMEVNLEWDEVMEERIRKKRWLGLQGSRVSKQILGSRKWLPEDYFIDIHKINNAPYMFFYSSSEGKLQLIPLLEGSEKKQVTIKLPSDSLPSFNVVDNMLVVHLKNQKITFIYDVNNTSFQTLVSPYPLAHEHSEADAEVYQSEFIGKRVVSSSGRVSKWRISLGVIHHYLKNEMQVFQFLHRRANSKMLTIRWMREHLFTFKQINLSKMWKAIFAKIDSGLFDQSELVSLVEIYSNLFYTLSIDPLINQEALLSIMVECVRQANQYRIILPDQLQALLAQMLLDQQKYDLFAYLCYQSVINPENKLYKLIYDRASREGNDLLLTLTLDMTFQSVPAKEVLKMIMKSQRLKEGKRFIKSSYDKLQALDILESAKYISDPESRKQFVSYVRFFITSKYPAMNPLYLREAEAKLFE